MSNVFNFADTWNNAGTTFKSIRQSVSLNGVSGAPLYAAASRWQELLKDGVQAYSIDVDGCIYQPQPTSALRKLMDAAPFDGEPSFSLNIKSYLFPGNARYDQVAKLGWNYIDDTRVDGEAGVGIAFESFYHVQAEGKTFSEGYFEYVSPDGTQTRRPFGFRTNQANAQTNASLQYTTINFLDDSSATGVSVGGMNSAANPRLYLLAADAFPSIFQLRNTSASGSAGWRFQCPGSAAGARSGDLEILREDGSFALSFKPTTGLASFAYGLGVGVAGSATSFLALGAGTTALSSLRIPSGAAPTSPVNGDIWSDGTDIFIRLGGVTKTFTLL